MKTMYRNVQRSVKLLAYILTSVMHIEVYLQLDESKISKYKEQVNEFFGCLQDGGSTSE